VLTKDGITVRLATEDLPGIASFDGDYFAVENGRVTWTGKIARGDNGITPHVGANGNWWIDTTDIGVKAVGYTPQKGIDYWTPKEKEEIIADVIASLPDASEVLY
jgi:hypothetical protein